MNTSQIHLDYPEKTMFQMVERNSKDYPNAPAYELYGNKTTYAEFVKKIEAAGRALLNIGIQRGDAVTICMPNIPQSLDCFYALNRIGAVANMIHPQSALEEVIFYLNFSKSKAILVPDMFYEKITEALKRVDHEVKVIVARIQDELPLHLKLIYTVKAGKQYMKYPLKGQGVLWTDFVKTGQNQTLPEITYEKDRTAVILYSGGTTGVPKGICLTDMNFNALALQAKAAIEEELGVGLKMLSCMPMFHGFGLGINIHTVLVHGACCILMPTFNPKTYADMIKKKKPNFIAGVPTIFEALLHMPQLNGVDLGFMKGMFC
ncbi:MAG: acyl--CoA ligase, partial [Lachnospiraceae bacterium]|nr:acyl--CoA ligase [Lachnospiraceae bacterium]